MRTRRNTTRQWYTATGLRSVLAALLAFSVLSWPFASARALSYPVTITVNADFTDWTGVLADADNIMADPTGASDPDVPESGADLSQVAFTWDATYLYGYTRLNTQAKVKLDTRIYIDLDADGVMSSTDVVAVIAYNPVGKLTSAGIAPYTPANAAGDPLAGNGNTPPGTVGTVAAVTNMTACAITNGRSELRIPWTALGLAPGSAVNMQFAVREAQKTFTIDNVNVVTSRYRGVTLVPSNTGAASIGGTIDYTHTLTNSGNGTDTYSLALSSSLGWPVSVIDPDTGAAITSITLAMAQAKTLLVRVNVPAGAAAGAKDVTTLRATSTAKSTVTAAVTDTTFAGPIGIDPNRTGSMAPGGTIEFAHTVSNNMTTAQTIALGATSNQGWTAGTFSSAGMPITSVDVAATSSVTILVRVVVPAGTPLDTIDVTTVRATMASEPTVYDEVMDTTTVKAALTVTPEYERVAGENTTVSFKHTITNSSAAERTFALAAASVRGWTVRIYDTDGTTLINSATVAAYGGFRDVWVRVTVPTTVPVGTVDTVTLTASHAASGLSATATNTITIKQVVTYDSSALTNPSFSFGQGSTVYAQGTGLVQNGGVPFAAVRFRFVDATGATVHTSPDVAVEPDDSAASSYTLDRDAAVGTWTCIVLNAANGAEITRSTFNVWLVPWVTITVDRTEVDFGIIFPDMPSGIEQIKLSCDSNAPYTITRSVSGTVAEMGFTVAGQASGLKPAGPNTWTDNYQALAPWTTDPATTLGVSVQYTVVP